MMALNYFNFNINNWFSLLAGVSYKYLEKDNFSKLKEVSITNNIESSNEFGKRSIQQKVTAFEGEYLFDLYSHNVALDIYVVPILLDQKIGFSGSARKQYNINSEEQNLLEFSCGVFFIGKSIFQPEFGIIMTRNNKKELLPGESRVKYGVSFQYNFLKSSSNSSKS